MNACQQCGIPLGAGFFDDSAVREAPAAGDHLVLASYQLHRNDCGVLMYFSQFTDRQAADAGRIDTPGYVWEVRRDGRPLSPYTRLEHIVNPWGMAGFPLHLRLESGSRVELVVTNLDVRPGDPRRLTTVGGRLVGRFWYDPAYGAVHDAA